MTHPFTYIDPNAKIASNVKIDPFTVIHGDVVIGEGTWIGSSVTIMNGTKIGKNCRIFPGAVIGADPQDLKFNGEKTNVEIGDNTTIREFVTINRGTSDRWITKVGNNCLIMAYSHIAHDCIIGNNVILVNLVALGGHVEIDDWSILGGASTVHQFCKIGKHVMLAANSKIVQDVPPYILAGKHPLRYAGINALGLSRRGFSKEDRTVIKKAYRYYFRSELNPSISLKKIKEEFQDNAHVNEIIDFIEKSDRGII